MKRFMKWGAIGLVGLLDVVLILERLTKSNEKRWCHSCGEPNGWLLLGKIPISCGDWYECQSCNAWYCLACTGPLRSEEGGFLKKEKVYCGLCDRQTKAHLYDG